MFPPCGGIFKGRCIFMTPSLRNRLIVAGISVFLIIALLAAGFAVSFIKAQSLSDELLGTKSKISELEQSQKAAEEEYNSKKAELEQKNADLEKKVSDLQDQIKEMKSRPGTTGGSNNKKVYLTFDDGPSVNTPEILSILKRYGAKATFFVINGGHNQYMKDIVNDGHAIALHSYSHDYPAVYASDAAFYDDLQKISDVVKSETGQTVRLTRFPGGSSNSISRKYSKGIMTRLTKSLPEKGYTYLDWNCSSGDADGNHIPAQQLVANVKNYTRNMNGNICVLMHDTKAKDTTVQALPEILEYFKGRGFTFEVLTESSPTFHHGKVNN